MSAPPLILTHGSTDLLMTGARIRRRADGFDEGRFTFDGGTESSLLPGFPVPGYAGMIVSEDDVNVDGDAFEHDVTAIGLRSGTSRLISQSATDVEDGFDTGTEVWIASDAASAFVFGRRHSKHSSLYALSVNHRSAPVSGYQYIELGFKGIKTGGKPDRWSVGSLAREIRKENFNNKLPGGDIFNAHTWNMAWGDVTVNRSYLSLSRPDTGIAPAAITPPRPPNFPRNFVFTALDSDITYNWPNGWSLMGVSYEEVAETGVCFVTDVYVYRPRMVP